MFATYYTDQYGPQQQHPGHQQRQQQHPEHQQHFGVSLDQRMNMGPWQPQFKLGDLSRPSKSLESSDQCGSGSSPSLSTHSPSNYAPDQWQPSMRIKNEKQEYIGTTNNFAPGLGFDPETHSFSNEELRPQPIIRKRKKVGGQKIRIIF
jgi:hypothetical protein